MFQTQAQPLFLGFPWLEDFLTQDFVQREIMLTPATDAGEGSGPILIKHFVITQGLLPSGAIAYCRLFIGEQTIFNGMPTNDADNQRINRHLDNVSELIHELATSRKLRVHAAKFAEPKDYVFMRGHSRLIKFNLATRQYERASVEPEPRTETDIPPSLKRG